VIQHLCSQTFSTGYCKLKDITFRRRPQGVDLAPYFCSVKRNAGTGKRNARSLSFL
jgi:hypothetical protein